MPLVHVYTKRMFFDPSPEDVALPEQHPLNEPSDAAPSGEHPLYVFAVRLTELVARALTVPGTEGSLTHADVEVRVEEIGPFDVFNTGVAIVVTANTYEKRLADLEERRLRLEAEVIPLLRELTRPNCRPKRVSTWFPLALGGAYGEADL